MCYFCNQEWLMPQKHGYTGGGPKDAGQATKVYGHMVNGKPVGKKTKKRKGTKKSGGKKY